MKSAVILVILVSLIYSCICVPASLDLGKQEADDDDGEEAKTTFSPVDLDFADKATTIDNVTAAKTESSSEEDQPTSTSPDIIPTTTPALAAADKVSQVDSVPDNSPVAANPLPNQDSSESDESDSSSSDEDSYEGRKKDVNVVLKKKDKVFEKAPGKLITKSKKYKDVSTHF